MKKTLATILTIASMNFFSSQVQAKDECLSYYNKQQSHNEFVSDKLQLEKALVKYAAKIKTDAGIFLSLSIENDHHKKYEIGAKMDPQFCDISNVFIHTSLWAKTNAGENEWVPQSTVTESSKGNLPFYSPYQYALKEISEVLLTKNKKFVTNDIPLAFLLVKYGKKNHMDNGEIVYVWTPGRPKSVVQFGPFRGPFVVGYDTDNDNVLDSLRFEIRNDPGLGFAYEDLTADGISAGDKQYLENVESEQIIGAPIAYNFFTSTQKLRSITHALQKRMKQ